MKFLISILVLSEALVFTYSFMNTRIDKSYLKVSCPTGQSIKMGFRDENFMPSIIKEKLEKGLLTPRELDRQFKLSQSETESILKISSSGFAGVIYSLDTSLTDLKQLFGYSYALLAGDIDQPTPHPKKVYDTMGSSFKTSVTAFGWNLDLKNLDQYEERYFGIMEKLIDKLPLQAAQGATASVNSILQERNSISVVTSLPRSLAILVMRKTRLGQLFEGRVPPDNLVCRPDLGTPVTVEGYSGQQLIQCCGYMRSPTVLTVYVDGNSRSMLRAKRDGLGVIGLQGFTENMNELKAADKVVPDVSFVTPTAVYKLIRERISYSEGPGQQTASSARLIEGGGSGKNKIVGTPYEDAPDKRTD